MTTPHPLSIARATLGWSQAELVRRSGISLRGIKYIEMRQCVSRLGTRRKLLLALQRPFSAHREVFGPRDGES